jgi:hypothetical protein
MSARRVRSRTIPYEIGGGGISQWFRDNFYPFSEGTGHLSDPPKVVVGSQITDSEGHPFKHRQGANVGDIGGDFYTVKQYVVYAQSETTINDVYSANGIDHRDVYVGRPIPMASGYQFPPIHDFSDHHDSMDENGAKAVNIVKPTNSVADLAVALGELRSEGLPKLPGVQTWKHRTQLAKKAGSEYLGVQFGWLPFVGEIKSLAHGTSNAERIISQYIRDAGKLVRRSIEFPEQEEFATSIVSTNKQPFYGATTSHLLAQLPYGNVIRDEKIVTKEKFSGGFTYHLPGDLPGFDAMRDHSLYAKRILGLDVSPDTVWNLTPWSWAVDWFSNTGSVISNVSDYATDGLVMRYGYMQRHIVHTYSYRHTSLPDVPPIIFVTETKMRRRANPFGFGLQWNGLTPRQLAISVALGIKRVL